MDAGTVISGLLFLIVVGFIMASDAVLPIIWFALRVLFCCGAGLACLASGTEHDRLLPKLLMSVSGAWALWIAWNALPDWELYVLFFPCYVGFIYLMTMREWTKGRLLYIVMPLLLFYFIGFDISNVGINDTNVAYVETETGGYFSDHTYADLDKVVNEQKIPYRQGAIFQVLDESGTGHAIDYFHVKSEDTQVGYLENNKNLKKTYRMNSEFAKEKQKEYISSKWYYRYVPRPLLYACQFVYEHSGILCYYKFID